MASFELTIHTTLSLVFAAAVFGRIETAAARRSFVTPIGSARPLPRGSSAFTAGTAVLATAFSAPVAATLRAGRRVARRRSDRNGLAFGVPHLVRNGVLLVLAVTVFAAALTDPTIRPQDVSFGVAASFLSVTFVDFAALFRRSVPETRTEPGR